MENKELEYIKIKEIDGVLIFKDKKGYFIFEHYTTGKKVFSLKNYLGKSKEEVEQTLSDILDWSYRYWHGSQEEAEAIMQAQKELTSLFY